MESSSTVPAWLIVVPIIIVWPIFFLALWSAILFFMSAAGGWRRLARTYATADAPVGGRTFSGITGMIGAARYKRTLIVTTNDAGLYLKTRRVFSIFHTPLFIPWSEISIRKARISCAWNSSPSTSASRWSPASSFNPAFSKIHPSA